MAGTLTISPVWRYGPSSPGDAYAGSQPDWYTAFLDGALRLVPPGWELELGGRTLTLAVLVPLAAIGLFFGLLTLWPFVEERLTGDRADHLRARTPPRRPLAHRGRGRGHHVLRHAVAGGERGRARHASCTSPSRA